MRETNEGMNFNNSLDKALSLIEYFTQDKRVWGLSELAKASNVPKATVYRTLLTLEEHGYLYRVERGEDKGKYKLGLKFLEKGKLVSEGLELRKIALPYMEELRDKLTEDVQLIVRDGNEAVYIEKIESPHPVRLYTRVGRKAPLYGGACPRAILTFMDDEDIERILSTVTLEKITSKTIIDKDKLFKMIQEDRIKGYTISYGELELDTVAVGAPIFDEHGIVIASVSIAGPEARFQGDKLKMLIEGIIDTAYKVSTHLGYRK